VYDLHAFSPFSRNTAWLKRVYLQKMIGHAGRRASMLLPMSQITAADLTKYIGVPEERMRVIPAILEPGFQRSEVRDVEQFRNRFGLPEHFWAYVAHLYPHKNHVKLLEAYSQLKRNGVNPWKMILRGNPAGGEEQVYRTIKELELADDIIWLPRLTQGDMANLYSAASGLVFPSKYEGGGIPVLEALGCGCPIIAADLPSLREFGGDAVSYFNPDSSAAIAESMKQFQSSNENREKRRQIGLARAEGFRAKQIIPRLIESYECCRKDDSSRHEPRKEIRAAGCVGRN
jgi:glycosyltransferase involved in cell wall biosynthesis